MKEIGFAGYEENRAENRLDSTSYSFSESFELSFLEMTTKTRKMCSSYQFTNNNLSIYS